MAIYQLYLFDAGGRLKESIELECGSDVEAKVYVEDQHDARAKELWCCGRVIQQYAAAA
ncbi:hypothetical protein [Phenylobacterium sp.]|uniref:hypothetical protein n=1 Tax=Phenylobacterium sp. TaxID=1871053 RepID=UPI0035626A30